MITGATSLTSKQTEQLKKAFTDLSWHEISQQLLSKFLLIIVTFVLFFNTFMGRTGYHCPSFSRIKKIQCTKK